MDMKVVNDTEFFFNFALIRRAFLNDFATEIDCILPLALQKCHGMPWKRSCLGQAAEARDDEAGLQGPRPDELHPTVGNNTLQWSTLLQSNT